MNRTDFDDAMMSHKLRLLEVDGWKKRKLSEVADPQRRSTIRVNAAEETRRVYQNAERTMDANPSEYNVRPGDVVAARDDDGVVSLFVCRFVDRWVNWNLRAPELRPDICHTTHWVQLCGDGTLCTQPSHPDPRARLKVAHVAEFANDDRNARIDHRRVSQMREEGAEKLYMMSL